MYVTRLSSPAMMLVARDRTRDYYTVYTRSTLPTDANHRIFTISSGPLESACASLLSQDAGTLSFDSVSRCSCISTPRVPARHFFRPPACSLSAVIVVLTLCIAVFIDSLFLDAWPSEMPRALTPRASASPERVALAWVGGTVTNIIVFELPPSESCSSSVRSDAPKGAFLEALEPSASMTCCSAASDLLAARGASPSPMATAYSAPTRSTRVSLPTEASPLSVLTERTVSVTTRLEPVEVASPLARAPCADARSERTWLAVCTGAVDSPSTCMPNVASRRMRKAGCDAPSESCRSRMASSTISSDERKSSNFIDSSTPVISSKRALTQRCSRPGSAAEPSSV
mmetsp:Transcript_72208/g.197701  ORF Transcript_72208/g.197701 Transcript_72208/m.197701 type:complete len:343 (-) Transcript_72208:587-1615(-)